MPKFFESLSSIHQFTSSLDSRGLVLACQHCRQRQAWASHGFVYKQRSIQRKEPVGKRIFCSNRRGKGGCGRTVQLYLSTEIPCRQYGTTQVFVFISALLAGFAVGMAYQHVAGQRADRQGWRWLSTLQQKLSEFRRRLPSRHSTLGDFSSRSTCLQLLLPTLQGFVVAAVGCGGAAFQLREQCAFF